MGGIELNLIEPPAADQMLENLQEGDELPFWAHVWDSGFGLCRRLFELANRESRSNSRGCLLELGCGIGLVGCMAAALGWDVTMTDYQLPALEYAACNLARNQLRANLVLTDWRSFALDGEFDLVVGSDILYESSLHPDLARVVGKLREKGASLLLADPGRPSALNFAAAREKEGWVVDLELYSGREAPVAIYVYGNTGERV